MLITYKKTGLPLGRVISLTKTSILVRVSTGVLMVLKINSDSVATFNLVVNG